MTFIERNVAITFWRGVNKIREPWVSLTIGGQLGRTWWGGPGTALLSSPGQLLIRWSHRSGGVGEHSCITHQHFLLLLLLFLFLNYLNHDKLLEDGHCFIDIVQGPHWFRVLHRTTMRNRGCRPFKGKCIPRRNGSLVTRCIFHFRFRNL